MSSSSPRFLYPSVYLAGTLALGAMVFNLHVLLHISIVGLAVFLSIVSLASYLRVAREKLLFITLAFMLLAMQEFVVLAQALSLVSADATLLIAGSRLEFGHLLTLLSLGFFSGGLFRNS